MLCPYTTPEQISHFADQCVNMYVYLTTAVNSDCCGTLIPANVPLHIVSTYVGERITAKVDPATSKPKPLPRSLGLFAALSSIIGGVDLPTYLPNLIGESGESRHLLGIGFNLPNGAHHILADRDELQWCVVAQGDVVQGDAVTNSNEEGSIKVEVNYNDESGC